MPVPEIENARISLIVHDFHEINERVLVDQWIAYLNFTCIFVTLTVVGKQVEGKRARQSKSNATDVESSLQTSSQISK